jgi:hypothetical protein
MRTRGKNRKKKWSVWMKSWRVMRVIKTCLLQHLQSRPRGIGGGIRPSCVCYAVDIRYPRYLFLIDEGIMSTRLHKPTASSRVTEDYHSGTS